MVKAALPLLLYYNHFCHNLHHGYKMDHLLLERAPQSLLHCATLPLLSPVPPSAPLFLFPIAPLFSTPLFLSLLALQEPFDHALPWTILSKQQEIERNPNKIWMRNTDPCTEKLHSRQGFLHAQARLPPVDLKYKLGSTEALPALLSGVLVDML